MKKKVPGYSKTMHMMENALCLTCNANLTFLQFPSNLQELDGSKQKAVAKCHFIRMSLYTEVKVKYRKREPTIHYLTAAIFMLFS